MIAIVDYGMGNLRSVQKALARLGHAAEITPDPERVARADRVIVPGVGAFGAAMANLRAGADGSATLAEAVTGAVRAGRPFLGICLGMQLLFTESDERGRFAGLGLVPGQVTRFQSNGAAKVDDLKVPHMGWNAVNFPRPSPLFAGLTDGTMFYFVHSYICLPDQEAMTTATSDHGGLFCAGLWHDNVHATQFHPEKSGEPGLRILDNFARL